jgi:hypothetical protein
VVDGTGCSCARVDGEWFHQDAVDRDFNTEVEFGLLVGDCGAKVVVCGADLGSGRLSPLIWMTGGVSRVDIA